MSTTIPLIAPSLPLGWCPTSEQDRATMLFNRAGALLPTGAGWTVKVSTLADPPTAAEQSNTLWLVLGADGSPTRLYKYSGGYWSSEHPVTASGSQRSLWVGTENDLWAFDGGDGTDPTTSPPTARTGAMWQVDHDFDFRALMGPGTSPDSTVLAVGANLGAEFITLAIENFPHQHPFGYLYHGTSSDDALFLHGSTVTIPSTTGYAVHGDASGESTTATSADLITGAPIAPQDSTAATTKSVLNPVRGIFVIKRTARTHYVV